jgi:hypothetical protein
MATMITKPSRENQQYINRHSERNDSRRLWQLSEEVGSKTLMFPAPKNVKNQGRVRNGMRTMFLVNYICHRSAFFHQNRFGGVVGYHVRLTTSVVDRERSGVRTSAKSNILFALADCLGHCFLLPSQSLCSPL